MKKIIYILALIAFSSCHQQVQKAKALTDVSTHDTTRLAPEDSLNAIIKANINKQPAVDTMFLGFSFGMTQKQAMAHFMQLLKQKKLEMQPDSSVVYIMNLSSSKGYALLDPEYENNKLYELTLIITPADDITTTEHIYYDTASAYMKKYSDYTSFQTADLLDPNITQYHWIKNNLHIFLRKTVQGTLVSYINTLVAGKLEKKDEIQTDSAKSQTNKDI